MSAGDLLIVEIPGFTPEIGRLVSMLNYVRSTTLAAIADLNVMTRRGRFSHRLLRVREPTSCDFGGHDVAVVLSLDGSTTVVSKQDVATLDHGDAAILLRERDTCFRIAPAAANDCYLVLLLKHRAG